MKALLDTNILVDYLNGIPEAKGEIALYAEPLISVITWMEVMVGEKPGNESAIRAFLSRFTRMPIDADIAERAVEIRWEYRVKLPDAIIWASADCASALLVTRNTRDFPPDLPGVRMPYRVG